MQLPDCFYRVSIKGLILNETRDKFLLCREDTDYWELPGGGLDWNTTPQEDLPREIAEEMGLKTTWVAEHPSYFLTGWQTNNSKTPIINVVYVCEVADLNITPSEECLEVKFVNAEDIITMQVFDGPRKLAEMFDPCRHRK